MVWQWTYSAFGEEPPTTANKRFTSSATKPSTSTGNTGIQPITYNLRYPGQVFDQESGLHYNYYRKYDPQTGRYTQPNPIGLEGGGWNRYGYVDGNLLLFVDPEGLARRKEPVDCNPNKKPPPPHRTPTGDRERNVGHPDGEEHGRRAKGQRGTRGSRGAGYITLDLLSVCGRVFVGAALLLTPSPLACSELPENCEARARREAEAASLGDDE